MLFSEVDTKEETAPSPCVFLDRETIYTHSSSSVHLWNVQCILDSEPASGDSECLPCPLGMCVCVCSVA